MHHTISGGQRDGRLRGEIFSDVRSSYIHQARHIAQRPEIVPTQKALAKSTPDRALLRIQRSVGRAEAPFGQITEVVAHRKLASLPVDLLQDAQLLQIPESQTVHIVVTHSTGVIRSEVEIAPQSPQRQSSQSAADGVPSPVPSKSVGYVGIRRLTHRCARLQITQRRSVRNQGRLIEGRNRRILRDRRSTALPIGRDWRRTLWRRCRAGLLLRTLRRSARRSSRRRLRRAVLRGGCTQSRTQSQDSNGKNRNVKAFAHRVPYGTTTVSPGFSIMFCSG